jgi:hypothetical protein
MKIDALALASRLSDQDLLARLAVLAANERTAAVELVAHLAVLDSRPSLYAGQGYGSLFSYCTHVLRLSEDATCNRIEAARACRRFPAILDRLASGALSLTSVRILSPHLSAENGEGVLARADGRSRREIEALVAELAPRPDVPSTMRKLPAPKGFDAATVQVRLAPAANADAPGTAQGTPLLSPPTPSPTHRPIIEMTAPERYRVQFTLGKESHDHLRRLQDLLRREIPNGDPAVIVARALELLLERVENQKRGATPKTRMPAATTDLPSIRPGADRIGWRRVAASRHIPRAIQRAVCRRDGDQCAFVSKDGHRCTERSFLEFHHLDPYALGGPPTIENISLRCRRHNQYEAELVFGPRARPSHAEAHDAR